MKSHLKMVVVSTPVLVAGCADALTVTAEEREKCDRMVSVLIGREAVSRGFVSSVRNHNGLKSARIIYQETSDSPGAQCDMSRGEVVSVVKFETLFNSERDAAS